MANKEHLNLVRQGREAIAAWRQGHPLGPLDLGGAYLRDTDLRGADLRDADLGNLLIWQVGPGGSRNDYTAFMFAPLCKAYPKGLNQVRTGCRLAPLEEFKAAVEETHGDNEHGRYYRGIIAVWEGMVDQHRQKES